MSRSNSLSSYGSVAKTFHWLTALLILSALPLGLIANDLAQQIRSPDFDGSQQLIARTKFLFSLHKTIGVTVFFTALARILWAINQRKPGLLHPDRKLETWAAETVHWLLYGSLVLVPLTGWIDHAATSGFAPIWWPFGQDLPLVPKSAGLAHVFAGLHYILGRVLIIALLLHLAGALKHHVIDRDATLRRMLPGDLPGGSDLPQPAPHRASALPLISALILWAAALGGSAATGFFDTSVPDQAAPDQVTVMQQPQLQQTVSDWQIQNGTLAISVTQMGSQVQGHFTNWTAAIDFDAPTTPGPAGQVDVTISIASLSLGSVTSQAMGADYFATETYPTARFQADIEKLQQGYQATGTLTIRDKVVPISLPFTLTLNPDGTQAQMAATLTLNRLDFDIGRSLPDETSLGFQVQVQIDLQATRGQ